ncbi:SDR family NAD(P)-dependent oxidoreductase [Celeribacter naphthalenivorans]|uniref:SDR family NAD(P)-dependent oxidoreductase n=1 Tax=Celeribacter naphthalenivorans TaxID=1614694 RepID=UPI001CFB83C4|nr:SDR family NAD(P)-dependent oxidoreductase [Celeribacter naphthalenivorans]
MSAFDFSSALVPVTGGASGIGFAICKHLRAAGATPLLLDYNAPQLEAALAELYPAESAAKYGYLLDVSSAETVSGIFDAIRDTHGPVTHAVANAGIVWRGNVMDMTDEEWRRVIDVNVNGAFYTCRAAARHMKENGGGSILTMASIGGLQTKAERAAYTSSKAALVQMTRAFAVDLAEDNIRVNCIAPGLINTPIQEAQAAKMGPEFIAKLTQRVAMKRYGSTDEIANVALFLLSDLASYMTGETVVVDGGMSIHYG